MWHVRRFGISIILLTMLLISISNSTNPLATSSSNDKILEKLDSSFVASDWIIGWQYRKVHQIIGSSGAGQNYQVKMIVYFGSGTDMSNEIYCDSNCQVDFDDIRFADNDGNTLLDYWRESYYLSDNATFWVEVKDNLDYNTTIFVYYGNSTCTTASNGTATFIFFDDYENNNLDRWDGTTGPGYSCATDQVVHGTYALKFQAVPGADIFKNLTSSGDALTHDFMVHSWVRDDNQLRGGHVPLVKSQSEWWVYACRGYNSQFSYFQGGADYVHWPYNYTGASDTWFEMEVGLLMSTDEIHAWKSGSYMGSIGMIASSGANVPDDLFQIGFGQQSSYVTWWDDTYVRKWIENEPTHGSWREVTIPTWHNDCSNSTGFVYSDAWNINWMPWDIQPGSLTSDGSSLTISGIATGTGYHGPVYEYELTHSLQVRDIQRFSSIMAADNSISSYLGYQVVMLGDADRNPILFFSFGDGWADYRQGAYGISYVFENGSRVGYGSGYPITWTSFNGEMNLSYTDGGLLAYVEGIGEELIMGLTEIDFNREIKYVALASARYGSDPMFPLLIDELYLSYEIQSVPLEPTIMGVEDYSYEAGKSGNLVSWTIANFNPVSYELWRDGGLLTSNVWPGGSEIEFSVDYLSPGDYDYTIIIYGDGDEIVSDSVTVTVTDHTSPSLGNPPDAIYEYGSTGHTIVWTASDLYPGNYTIIRDSTILDVDEWTSGSISISTDGLDIGTYEYIIMVFDEYDNFALDNVSLTVVDTTIPILNHPSDITGDLSSGEMQISWQPTDLLPFNYEIYNNGTLVESGTWTSGENLTYVFEPTIASSYNITIVVWDTSGNTATDSVFVNINHELIEPFGDVLILSISIGSLAVIVVVIGMICRDKGGTTPKTSVPNDYSW